MNKVMLIGNLGADPLVRYYDADQAVAQFRLATTERGYTLPNGKGHQEGHPKSSGASEEKG